MNDALLRVFIVTNARSQGKIAENAAEVSTPEPSIIHKVVASCAWCFGERTSSLVEERIRRCKLTSDCKPAHEGQVCGVFEVER
jgi:hypothetical protein